MSKEAVMSFEAIKFGRNAIKPSDSNCEVIINWGKIHVVAIEIHLCRVQGFKLGLPADDHVLQLNNCIVSLSFFSLFI